MQVLGNHRLDEMLIEARVERVPAVLDSAVPAQRHEARLRAIMVVADATGQIESAHHRKTKIHKREVRPSNAMQWRMLRDAYALGASVYDLRGISDSLDETDHLFGLIQFKVGTGGQAAEYLGEWDFPLNKLLHKALDIYMSRR